jgi:hypothetical protein
MHLLLLRIGEFRNLKEVDLCFPMATLGKIRGMYFRDGRSIFEKPNERFGGPWLCPDDRIPGHDRSRPRNTAKYVMSGARLEAILAGGAESHCRLALYERLF